MAGEKQGEGSARAQARFEALEEIRRKDPAGILRPEAVLKAAPAVQRPAGTAWLGLAGPGRAWRGMDRWGRGPGWL